MEPDEKKLKVNEIEKAWQLMVNFLVGLTTSRPLFCNRIGVFAAWRGHAAKDVTAFSADDRVPLKRMVNFRRSVGLKAVVSRNYPCHDDAISIARTPASRNIWLAVAILSAQRIRNARSAGG